jgi:biopolymer transport protein ExbD
MFNSKEQFIILESDLTVNHQFVEKIVSGIQEQTGKKVIVIPKGLKIYSIEL